MSKLLTIVTFLQEERNLSFVICVLVHFLQNDVQIRTKITLRTVISFTCVQVDQLFAILCIIHRSGESLFLSSHSSKKKIFLRSYVNNHFVPSSNKDSCVALFSCTAHSYINGKALRRLFLLCHRRSNYNGK